MKEIHLKFTDEEFREKFENFDLPSGTITHEAHFRIAWVYIKDYDFETALEKVNEGIKNYDNKHGDGTKYHATITYAYMKILESRAANQHYDDWQEFIFENEDLLKPVDEVLLKYYNKETLFSDRAKSEFLEPDLAEF